MGRLLNTESPLQVLPVLALKIGLNECIVLQQIHYWLNPQYNKHFYEERHWVFNGYKEWQQQFPFLSPSTIKRTIHSLEQQNLIFTCQRKQRSLDHRKWYSINYEILEQVERTNYRSYRHHQKEETRIHTDEDLDTLENSLYVVEDKDDFSKPSKVSTFPKRAVDVSSSSMTGDCGRASSDTIKDVSSKEFRLDQNDRSGQNDLPLNKVVESNGSKWAKLYKEQRLQAEITTETSPLTCVRDADQMLEVWNKIFGQSLLMTASRGVKLEQGLDRYFSGDIRAWQQFCESVLSSSFLQGQGPRGWRATLDWCLEEDNLVKILEGNYRDKISETPCLPTACESVSKAQSHIETLGSEDRLMAQEVCDLLGASAYSSWFEGMKVASMTQDRILLTFPTKFIRTTVDVRYLSALRQITARLYPGCWLDLGVEDEAMASNGLCASSSERPETAASQHPSPMSDSRDIPRTEATSAKAVQRPTLTVVKDLAHSLASINARPQRPSRVNLQEDLSSANEDLIVIDQGRQAIVQVGSKRVSEHRPVFSDISKASWLDLPKEMMTEVKGQDYRWDQDYQQDQDDAVISQDDLAPPLKMANLDVSRQDDLFKEQRLQAETYPETTVRASDQRWEEDYKHVTTLDKDWSVPRCDMEIRACA